MYWKVIYFFEQLNRVGICRGECREQGGLCLRPSMTQKCVMLSTTQAAFVDVVSWE
ncbi:unnamed protein product [Ectocarpus sp. CCAP 1310/34]|nr:unnamed protein product [Ectocarpus sp. CCAP 1310/34]